MNRLIAILLLFVSHLFAASDILVLTMASGVKYKQLVRAAIENKRAYCRKHKYDFICWDAASLNSDRSIWWSKFLLIQKIMREKPQYKWIFWTDADSLFMNFGIPLEFFLDEKYNLIIGGRPMFDETWDWHINNGEFFLRNCDWSNRLIQASYDHFELENLTDQEGMVWELNKRAAEWMPLTKIVPYRVFNSWGPDGPFTLPGDFIIHFAGMGPNHHLKDALDEYSRKAVDDPDAMTLDYYLSCYKYNCNFYKYDFTPQKLSEAQKALFLQELMGRKISKVLEVGFNDGYVAEFLFKTCKELKFYTALDVDHSPCVEGAADFFAGKYKGRFQCVQELKEVPDTFDLIYLRGDLEPESFLQYAHPETLFLSGSGSL